MSNFGIQVCLWYYNCADADVTGQIASDINFASNGLLRIIPFFILKIIHLFFIMTMLIPLVIQIWPTSLLIFFFNFGAMILDSLMVKSPRQECFYTHFGRIALTLCSEGLPISNDIGHHIHQH
ncbi:hypothetical protein ACJX0J_021185 [Zea mays]